MECDVRLVAATGAEGDLSPYQSPEWRADTRYHLNPSLFELTTIQLIGDINHEQDHREDI